MLEVNASAVADGAWLVALAAMALRSLDSWRALPEDAPVPLQWGEDGRPTILASRALGLTFTPVLAAVGGLLLASAERMGDGAPTVGLLMVRLIAPVVLAVAHMRHLDEAVRTVTGSRQA